MDLNWNKRNYKIMFDDGQNLKKQKNYNWFVRMG